jgi:hypothetical protein
MALNKLVAEIFACRVSDVYITEHADYTEVEIESCPGWNLNKLTQLGKLFNSDNVDVDNYSQHLGCKTCGFNYSVTTTFQVYR